MRFDVYKVELGMYPASIINFLSNDDTPPFRAGSVILCIKYKIIGRAEMPEISLFYGIRITMNWNEHSPPHFHVRYAEYSAMVLIQECVIGQGYLPNKQLKMILAWCEIHKDELMQNWELAADGKPLNSIPPLV